MRGREFMKKYLKLSFVLCTYILSVDCGNRSWVYELEKLDGVLEKRYKSKYELFLCGTGGGGVQGFHRYSPQFYKYSSATKEEARGLILLMGEEVLNDINHNKILVEGMVSYPFSPKNLGLDIYFRMPDGNFVNDGEICVVGFSNNAISYGLQDAKIAPLVTIEEPLKEALEKVEGSRERFPYLWECTHPKEAEQGQ